MSLFIASLAFEHGGADEESIDRLTIIIASVISALWGVVVLKSADSNHTKNE